MSAQGPSRQAINASYHLKGGGTSPSLQRARKPFKIGNAVIGSAIALFAAGVYTYSISSVRQDDFSDVEDLLPPLADRSQIQTIEDEARAAQKTSAFQSVISTLPSRPSGGSTAPPTLRTSTSDVSVPVTHSPDSPAKALPSVIGVADAELGIGSSASDVSSTSNLGREIKQAGMSLKDEIVAAKEAASKEVDKAESWISRQLPWPSRLDGSRWIRERGMVELGKGNVIVWGAPNVDRVGYTWDDQGKRSKGGRLV